MAPAWAAEPPHPLNVADAIQLALTRNERAQIANLQVAVADAALEKARAGFLPSLSATAQLTGRPYRTNLPRDVEQSAITLVQPLINASAWPLYLQSASLLEAQRASTTDAKRLLAFDATTTFLEVLSVEQVLEAARRRVASAQANLADTQARVEAQLNSSNDVTRAQVSLAAAEQEVALDLGGAERAHLQLAFVLNAPVADPLEPPAETLQAAAQPQLDAAALLAVAAERRPDLIAARHSLQAARYFADEPLLRLVPAVNLTGAFTATSNPPNNGRWNDQTLGGTLSWPLYDSGIRYADKHSRDAAAEIAQLQVSTLERSIANDVHDALASLHSAQAAFEVAARAVTAARRNVDETGTLYRQGLAKAIELTDANDSRFLAEVGYVGAQYATALAYVALRQAMGLDPVGKDLR
jgi:outer membrane protein TolC